MIQEQRWKQLSHLLQEECRAYGILLSLLKKEWSVLRTLNYQELLKIAAQKEEILLSITDLERDRIACGHVLDRQESEGQSLQWLAESTRPQARPAQRVLKELHAIGSQVKRLSDRNAELLNRGLHVVRGAMMVVQEGLGLQPVYGESGQLSTPSMATSLNVEG